MFRGFELWQATLVSLTLTFGCASTQLCDSCLLVDVHKVPVSTWRCGRRATAPTAPDFKPCAALAVACFEPHIHCWLQDILQSSGISGQPDAAFVTLFATVVAGGTTMTCRGLAQVCHWCHCLFIFAAGLTELCIIIQICV